MVRAKFIVHSVINYAEGAAVTLQPVMTGRRK